MNKLALLLLLFVSACVPEVDELKLRGDDIGASVVIFGNVNITSITGPFTNVSVEFEPKNAGLSQEQIDGLQGYIAYRDNGNVIRDVDLNARTFPSQLTSGQNYCFRMGIRTIINGTLIRTLPGNAEICFSA